LYGRAAILPAGDERSCVHFTRIHDVAKLTRPQTSAARRAPKTTRPKAIVRRARESGPTAAEQIGKTLDAFPDSIDLRDWLYRPSLAPLPPRVVNCNRVPEILDQGTEGACTGFALAAVIQYHLGRRAGKKRVSPRMIYELARRYDKWPGEGYEGSSARGAMKGWVAHGVATRKTWPDDLHGKEHFTPAVADEARKLPGGAYYRVRHRDVRDMHAALVESGILYITLMVHSGWKNPSGRGTRVDQGLTLPVIERRDAATDGHAVAIVGYTEEGFIVQNSWGESWGEGGFALLPYEDYLIHATDVWAAQIGVPITIDLWATVPHAADTTAGLQRAAPSIPLADIRPYIVDAGNDGQLSDAGFYWTTEADIERLFTEAIPAAAKTWKKQRVLLYLHGGFNSEADVAKRVVAFRDVFLANEIYPLHLMWESGAGESLRDIIREALQDDRAGGIREWLSAFRNHLVEAKDRTFELTVSVPGTKLWNEMKENARQGSGRLDGNGAMQLLIKHAVQALARLDANARKQWELHVVAHSAGSIYAAYALEQLTKLSVRFRTLTFMAPAITTALFKARMLQPIVTGAVPMPTMFILSDQGERDDNVGPYGKSLLYLVSNAFEGRRDVPILGMQRFIDRLPAERVQPDPDLVKLFTRTVDGRPAVVVAGVESADPASRSKSDTHGGFDNDEWTMNSVLRRILGEEPRRLFTMQDLQY
jgi:hypothetical protein